MPLAFDGACVHRSGLAHQFDGVGELIFAIFCGFDLFEEVKNFGTKDIASEGCEI